MGDDYVNHMNRDDWLFSPGNIRIMKQSRNIVFKSCSFFNLGGAAAIEASGGTQGVQIYNSTFDEIAGAAVILGETSDFEETDEQMQNGNFIFADNSISNVPSVYAGMVPITAGYVKNTIIEHNEVLGAPYSAISMGWGWGRENSYAGNNVIRGNRIHRAMQILSDGGSIYTLGPQDDSIVTENYITGQQGGGNCLYHDNGSSGFRTFRNVEDNNVGEGTCQSVFINGEDVSNNPDPYVQTVLVENNWFRDASNYTQNCPEVNKCEFKDNEFYDADDDLPPEALEIAELSGPRR